MSTKICTSIDQSKKLLSLGLDPSTADMGWNIFVDGTIRLLPIDDWDLSKDGSNNVKLCYAWSLAALLELMPDIIKVEEECYTFSLTKNVIEYVRHDGNILYSAGGESLVDAAVKMFELIDK